MQGPAPTSGAELSGHIRKLSVAGMIGARCQHHAAGLERRCGLAARDCCGSCRPDARSLLPRPYNARANRTSARGKALLISLFAACGRNDVVPINLSGQIDLHRPHVRMWNDYRRTLRGARIQMMTVADALRVGRHCSAKRKRRREGGSHNKHRTSRPATAFIHVGLGTIRHALRLCDLAAVFAMVMETG